VEQVADNNPAKWHRLPNDGQDGSPIPGGRPLRKHPEGRRYVTASATGYKVFGNFPKALAAPAAVLLRKIVTR
jgi:hypothetical protein